jgi:class I fructose-bisphosphate aldolase
MNKLMRDGKSLILAYDQGLEHGPTDFNDKNVDPTYVVDIARRGGFDAFVSQKGIAERYYNNEKVPLLLKLNGKTAIYGKEPMARQNCSVEYAIKLGASAVGYTIYIGSAYESEMMAEFGRIQEEAHAHNLPAILWIYPRGEFVKNDTTKEMVAYAARAGMELGADAVKIKYSGDIESFRWAVRAAGKTPVYMAGGPKTATEDEFLRHVSECVKAGASGVAVGRNAWQSDDPFRTARRLNAIVIQGKPLEEALKIK